MAAYTANSPNRSLWWFLAVILLVRLLTIGAYPVADTTEARYSEIARKMVELGDLITPWYDYGVPFWAKPPLSTWISAGSMKLFGVNEFAARLPNFLVALTMLWLLWSWLKQYSRREAQFAIVLLAGTSLLYTAAGAVMTDMALALGLILAMRGFWLGLHGDGPARKREAYGLFFGLALGLLAKGPLALVLAGVPFIGWTLFSGKWRNVLGLPWGSGILMTMALALPWYVMAEIKTPGFLEYFLVGEHWHRFTVPGWAGDLYGTAHSFPRGSIWLFGLAACLPWTLLLPLLMVKRIHTDTKTSREKHEQRLWRAYLWLWALTPCLFFTFAGNILWTYVLPALPALATLTAGWLALDARKLVVERVLICGMLITVGIFVSIVVWRNMQDTWKTADVVVRAYQEFNNTDSTLLFLDARPYSADFYSHGKAELVTGTEELNSRLAQVHTAFVAMTPKRASELPVKLRGSLKSLGTHGNYQLYRYDRK